MRLYLSKGSIWTGTQADAKAAQGGTDYETIEIPEPKAERIAWLNEQWAKFAAKTQSLTMPFARPDPAPAIEAEPEQVEQEQEPQAEPNPGAMRPAQMARFEALAKKMGWTPPGDEKPIDTDAISDAIDGLTGHQLEGVLMSAIARLHETSGPHGWASFAKNVYAYGRSAQAVERGLGMLFLAALNQSDQKIPRSDQPSA